MHQLRLASDIRLVPADGSLWLLFRLRDLKCIRVPASVAQMLMSTTVAKTQDEHLAVWGVSELGAHAELRQVLEALIALKVLVDNDDPDERFLQEFIEEWRSRGWIEAADHHLVTYGHPFADYSFWGGDFDCHTMDAYRATEADPPRWKSSSRVDTLPCPQSAEVLSHLNQPAAEALAGKLSTQDEAALPKLLGSVMGILRRRKVSLDESVPPLVRKTSPSGGSLHPTEAYLVVISPCLLRPGIYHFDVGTNSLSIVHGALSRAEVERILDGPLRAPFEVTGALIFTSVVERNMFRYREPRTWRTILMDVGHIIATAEMIASSLGLMAFPHHGIDEVLFEQLLNLDPLVEPALFGLALGWNTVEP